MKSALPGRLIELKLYNVEVEHHDHFVMVVFVFNIDDDFIHIMYDVEKRKWDIDLDDVRFENIPSDTCLDTAGEYHAKEALRKLLTEYEPKRPKSIQDIKRWRNKMQVYPAKLVTLNTVI